MEDCFVIVRDLDNPNQNQITIFFWINYCDYKIRYHLVETLRKLYGG